LGERIEHVLGGVRVEVARSARGEEDARRVGHRTRDGDSLLLAAGELRRRWVSRLLSRDSSTARRGAPPRLATPEGRDHLPGRTTFSDRENSGSRW